MPEIVVVSYGNKNQIKKNKYSLQIYTMNSLHDMLAINGFKVIEQHKIDAYTFQTDDKGHSILTVNRRIFSMKTSNVSASFAHMKNSNKLIIMLLNIVRSFLYWINKSFIIGNPSQYDSVKTIVV